MKAIVFITALLLVATSLRTHHGKECELSIYSKETIKWNFGFDVSEKMQEFQFRTFDDANTLLGSLWYEDGENIHFTANRIIGDLYNILD